MIAGEILNWPRPSKSRYAGLPSSREIIMHAVKPLVRELSDIKIGVVLKAQEFPDSLNNLSYHVYRCLISYNNHAN
jgi:hypothetical protein